MHRKRLYAVLLSASMIAGQGAMPVMAEDFFIIEEADAGSAEDTLIVEEDIPVEAEADVAPEEIIIPEIPTEEVAEEVIPEIQEEIIEAPVDAIVLEEEAIQEEASAFDEIIVEEAPVEAMGVIDSFTALQEAINNAADGDTITLTSNIDSSLDCLEIPREKNITLDISSYNLNVYYINNYGKLKIIGTSGVISVDSDCYLLNGSDANMEIAGGVISSNIYTNGLLSISGGKIGGEIDSDYGEVSISGGLFANSPDADWIASGYRLIENTDPETMGTYLYTVVQAKATQTITTYADSFTKPNTDSGFDLGASVDPENTLEFKSSNENVVTVDNKGYVTIKGAGTAEITITAPETDDYAQASKTVTVTVKTNVTSAFKDPNFAEIIRGRFGISADAPIYAEDCATIKYLSVYESGISDLSGIEYLTSLVILDCRYNQLSSLDVSKCVNLAAFWCSDNYLTADTLILPAGSSMKFGDSGTVQQHQKITIPEEAYTKCPGDEPFSLGASASSAITYTSSDKNVVTVDDDGLVTIVAPGTAKITLEASGDEYYYSADESKTVTVTVNKLSQTITVPATSYTKTYGDAAFNLNATAQTSLSYASDNTAVAAVSSDGTVTVKGSGIATITINAEATSSYEAASKTVTIRVKPATAKITKVAPAYNGLTLTWGRVASADGYVIYRSKDGINYSFVKRIADNSTVSFTDTGATTNNTRYSYKVMTYKAGESGNINGALSAAAAYYRYHCPRITSASNPAAGKVRLGFVRNSAVTAYQVQMSTSSDFSTSSIRTIRDITQNSTTFSGLTKGRTYYFRMRSYKQIGSKIYLSVWGDTVEVIVNN